MEERKYFVKAAYRANLDSMLTKLHCISYDMEAGEYDTITLMGKVYDIETIEDFKDEVRELLGYANWGKVTGKQYGRIKAISDARDWMRYNTCISKGMDESKAAYAFMG